MRKVALNDTVRIDYTAKRASDGFVFESTIREVALKAGLREREVYEPLKFTVGAGKVIPVGLEGAVLGMSQGEFKIATVPAAEGFGVHNDSLVFVANKSDLVYGGESLHAGQWLLEQFGGANCMVLNVSNSTFTADCNHPLAGEALEFEITLVEIANASR
ncbi:hypothetical protein AUJ16_02130 [Candidatus Micrarchaeota archaeon CG1_02_60_51]|nr:MAG: hypothetical protein AUJ16_02130 [Candidatus Micrarchaeota archaeon CG1_02_60_51]